MSCRVVWLVFAKASQNNHKRQFGSNHEHYNVLRRTAFQADSGTKRSEGTIAGTFKINDGSVVGVGVYEIGKDGKVDIDLKIKIIPSRSGGAGGGGNTPNMAPAGGGSTPPEAPGGGGSTPNEGPGGGGSNSAEAPVGGGSTPNEGEGSTSPSQAAGGDDDQIALSVHNKFREVHNAPPMTLNTEMSKAAKNYAEKLARTRTFRHASEGERDGAGENLSFGCSSKKRQTPEEAVTLWYNEVCNPGYTFGGKKERGTGHFTQVVWKTSTELGFGSASAEQGGMKCTYYVGRYKEAGNQPVDYDKYVEKGSFDKQSYCPKVSKKAMFFKL
ncbi:protein PRY1-like isoform X2 [Nematostella vectensis]|uniref:protein PRY1-like isoform X2 n=1 Tax=Nematostella vectensis TaxID=45351 RepID=UPI002077267D|nr:protein PRY1-like isoform X2 [Nematostella vectensis]